MKTEGTLCSDLFLGFTNPDEVERLEDDYFADDALFADLVDGESRLISDYREDILDARLKERFESHYLNADCRREEFALQCAIGDLVKVISADVNSDENEEAALNILQERTSPEALLVSAFTRFVFPLLPRPADLRSEQPSADIPRTILAALFAYSMLLQRLSVKNGVRYFEWSDVGLESQGSLVCAQPVIETEIRTAASISERNAAWLTSWISSALCAYGDLIPGARARVSSKHILRISVERQGLIPVKEIIAQWENFSEERGLLGTDRKRHPVSA